MTLLIKNVKVLGGVKDFGDHSDVFVVGDKISAIGTFPQKDADLVLDGQGGYLAPGFIDIGSTADHYLDIFDDPSSEHLLAQGITTIVGGQCGFSLAPLLYGRLDMIRKWTDVDKLNIDWHTMKEFFASLKERKMGVNFATFTGHLTVRQELVGDAERDLTQNELSVFKKVIDDSLSHGSAGVSFGLEYSHGKGTPFKEIKMLAESVAKVNGICAVHLRRRDKEIAQAFEEVKTLAEAAKAKVLVSHFSPMIGAESEYEKVLAELYDLPAQTDLYLTARPFEENIVPIYFMLPGWAQKGSLEEMLHSVKDEWLSSRVMKDIPQFDPEKVRILKAVKNESLEGKNFKELMEIFGLSTFAETLRKIMITTGLRATVTLGELDPKLLIATWKNPRAMVGTFAPKAMSSNSTLMHFLGRVEKEELFSLEDAVWKVSGFPAKVLGFKGRGRIGEGYFADLTVFKNGEVKFTILGGNLAYRPGEETGLFGEPKLRKKNGF